MKEFLKKHGACQDGYKWAVKNCKTIQEVWDTATPEWLVWVATREGVLTGRELHEFGLWSANQVRHLMTDPRSIAALDIKRGWLDGKNTDQELAAARAAARAAAWAAARDAAWDAARAAARAAAWDAAWDAARAKQAAWLRTNTKTSFV
jgi:hypothetical protein